MEYKYPNENKTSFRKSYRGFPYISRAHCITIQANMAIETEKSEILKSSTALTEAPAVAAQGRRRISASVVNFWVDLCLLMLLSLLGWVSAVLQVVFPAPTAADGWTLWGLTFDQWRDIQFGTLSFFAGGILLHVMLHWKWVCSVITAQILRMKTRPDDGMQTIYGVATLIVLLHLIGIGVLVALLCVHRPPE
jgi:hypothetical protein